MNMMLSQVAHLTQPETFQTTQFQILHPVQETVKPYLHLLRHLSTLRHLSRISEAIVKILTITDYRATMCTLASSCLWNGS